jgi:hypothetical protein
MGYPSGSLISTVSSAGEGAANANERKRANPKKGANNKANRLIFNKFWKMLRIAMGILSLLREILK